MKSPSGRTCRSRAALALAIAPLLVLALAAAGCGGGGGDAAATSTASATIGPGGGEVRVTSGPLAGSSIVVPAGALAGEVAVEIAQGADLAGGATGTVAAGVAAAFAPGGTTFSASVTITIPTSGLPDGAVIADVVVLLTTDGGSTVVRLAPATVDLAHGLVTVETSTLGTLQVAVVVHDAGEPTAIGIGVLAASISEEGEATDAVVTRTGDLTRQVVVQLAAAPGAVLSIPAQLTILAGEASGRFVVQAEDNHLLDGTRTALITATVAGATPAACAIDVVSGDVDEPPVADALAISTDEDTQAGGSLTATDVNAQPITFSIVSNGAKGTAVVTDASTGAFTYAPTTNANGADAFTYKATANGLDSEAVTVTVTIAPVNDAPVGTAGALVVTEDLTAAGTLAGADVEGDALTFAVAQQGTRGAVTILDASAGAYSYTPLSNTGGADVFTFTASDGLLASAEQSISVSITAVNDAPVASGASITMGEDTPEAGALAASDVDSAVAAYQVLSGPSKGTLDLVTATGAFTFTPGPDLNGADSFTFRAIDADAAAPSNVTTVSITITPVNDAPVAAAGAVSTSEDTPRAATLAASDVDSAVSGYEVLSGPSKGTVSLVTATGAFTFTPGLNLNGADSFTFRAIDADSSAPSNVTTVSISIAPVNDAPVAAAAAIALDEDTPRAATLSASDVDSAVASFQIVSGPSKGALSLVTATGAYTYTPTGNTNGADVFTFRAIDSDSAAPSNTTQVSIAITAVNDAPTLDAIGGVAIAEDAPLQQITLTGISRGPPDEAGQTLSITASSGDTTVIPTPSISYAGSATTGTLSFTPAADRSGLVTITVTAQDGGLTANGGADTMTRTFTVNVTAVNDTPVASNRSYGLARNVTKTVDAASGLLQSGFVSDADPGDVLAAVFVAGPSFGTLTSFSADGSFAYQPPQDVTGTATFTYRVSDSVTLSAVATVSLQISSANATPTAAADGPFNVSEDATLILPAPGILANDGDPDGDSLVAETATAVPASQGALTLNPSGALTFVPAADFFGPVSFTYRARDPFGATSTAATVSIEVVGVNDPPTFAVQGGTGPRSFQEDSGANAISIASISPGNSFEAVAGQTVSLTAIVEGASPSNLFSGFTVATVGPSAVTTNAITLTPAANLSGTASLRIRVTDSVGLASTADVVISLIVQAVNDAPDFTATTPTAQEDTLATVNVTGITAGPSETDTVSFSAQLVSETVAGLVPSLSVSPAGFASTGTNRTVSFTPGTDRNGSAQIRITAADNGSPAPGTTTSKVVTVVVSAVNDAPTFTLPGGTGPITIDENGGLTTISVTAIRPGPVTATDEAGAQTTTLATGVTTQSPGGLVTGLAVTTPGAQAAGASNSITFTPAGDTTGTASIRVTATDSATSPLSTTLTVSYTVQNVNDAPDFTAILGRTTSEDTPLAVSVLGITAGPNDPDTLTLTVVTANASPPNLVSAISVTPGSLGPAGGGATINLSTGQDLNGGVDVTFKVQDSGTGALFKQETFHVTVSAVNDAPVGVPVDMETLAGVAVQVPLSGTDVETAAGSVTFTAFGSPVNGSVSIVGSTATFTPNGTFNVTASVPAGSFQFKASDGTTLSTAVTVRIYRTRPQKVTSLVNATNFRTLSGAWEAPSAALAGYAIAHGGADLVTNDFNEGDKLEVGDAVVSHGNQVFILKARKVDGPGERTLTNAISGAAGLATTDGNLVAVACTNGYAVVNGNTYDDGADGGTAIDESDRASFVTHTTGIPAGAYSTIALDNPASPAFLFLGTASTIVRVAVTPSGSDLASSSGTSIHGGGSSIQGLAVRANGDVFFTDGSALRRIPGATGSAGTAVVVTTTAAGTMHGLVFNSAGNVVVAVQNGASDELREVHPVTGAVLATKSVGNGNPRFVAIDFNLAAIGWAAAATTAPSAEVLVGAKLSLDVVPTLNSAACWECHTADVTPVYFQQTPFFDSNGDGIITGPEFRTATLGVTGSGCGGATYILSGGGDTNANNSYVVDKVSNTPVCPSRMPDNGMYLTEVEVELLKSWVRSGAPNN